MKMRRRLTFALAALSAITVCVAFCTVSPWASAAKGKETEQTPKRPVAPPFSLKDIDGRTHSLKSQKGRVVVLDFGRAICIPCRRVLADLSWLHGQYSRKGVTVYSVNLGVDAAQLRQYARENKLNFPFLEDPGYQVTESYGVQTIPCLVFIDRKGRIAATHTGYNPDFRKTLETEVGKLLAEEAK